MDSDRKTIDGSAASTRRVMRAAGRVIGVLLAAVVIIATLLLSAYAALAMTFGVGTGYGEPTTAVGWIQAIDQSTRAVLQTSAVLVVALLVTGLIAVVGGYFRRTGWMAIGILCSAVLGLVLMGVSSTSGDVEALADRAAAAVGSAPAVAPLPPAADPLTVDEAREAMLEMLSATIDAGVAPVATADGAMPIADASQLQAVPCGDTGARWAAALELSTADNAASLSSILSVWDAAGYLPDRAMQEDIRYSATLPVERLSIRDETTIDGLVHLRIESACAVAAG